MKYNIYSGNIKLSKSENNENFQSIKYAWFTKEQARENTMTEYYNQIKDMMS